MTDAGWIEYHFAVLRAVPHVYRDEFVNVGVVLHSRSADFLGLKAVTDTEQLSSLVRDADIEMLSRYLEGYRAICDGDPAAGQIALLSRPERFHWISAPRSDLLQSSPVHEGICLDPAATLAELFTDYVRA